MKLNPKVYDVISWLNKNLKTHFVKYLEKDSRFDIFLIIWLRLRPTLGHYRGDSLTNPT